MNYAEERFNELFPNFSHRGNGYEPANDEVRLQSQMERVFNLMQDGVYRTHLEIKNILGGSETGIAAALRVLRRPSQGGHTVLKRRRGEPSRGIWEYNLIKRS